MRPGRSFSLALAVGGLWLAGLAVDSCYSPSYVSGVTKCSSSGACPNGWVCEASLCVDLSSVGSGGSSATGGSAATGKGGNGSGGSAGGGHGGSGTGTGGSVSSGGATGTGGSASSGGATGAGGSVSSGGATGAGGSVSSGGISGTGGAVGSGGVTGTGGATGSGGAPVRSCLQGESDPPTTPLITDFSDAVTNPDRAGDFLFGGTKGLPGGTARYASGVLGTLSLSGGALTFSATLEAASISDPNPYNGFSLYIDGPPCTNASAYSGVQFNLSVNVTSNCQVLFMFSDSDHLKATDDPDRGSCAASSCYASQYYVSSATGGVSFNATPLIPGSPTAAVDVAKLTGVQWQLSPLNSSSCSGTVTVDNVTFY